LRPPKRFAESLGPDSRSRGVPFRIRTPISVASLAFLAVRFLRIRVHSRAFAVPSPVAFTCGFIPDSDPDLLGVLGVLGGSFALDLRSFACICGSASPASEPNRCNRWKRRMSECAFRRIQDFLGRRSSAFVCGAFPGPDSVRAPPFVDFRCADGIIFAGRPICPVGPSGTRCRIVSSNGPGAKCPCPRRNHEEGI